MGRFQSCDLKSLDMLFEPSSPLAKSHDRRKLKPYRSPTGFVGSFGFELWRRDQWFKHCSGVKTQLRKSFIADRFGPRHFDPKNSKRQAGFLSLQFLVFWIPLFAIFGVILWIRSLGLDYLERQRSLDRCIFSVLRSRCSNLTELSKSNAVLRKLVHALALIESAKAVSLVIPGLNGVLVVAAGAPAQGARATAKAIAKYQDFLIASDTFNIAKALRCGIPINPLLPLSLTRSQNAETVVARAPGPLQWKERPSSSFLNVLSWDLKTRSFGYCHTTATKSQHPLDGEEYSVSFRAPDRQRLKRWSSWQWP